MESVNLTYEIFIPNFTYQVAIIHHRDRKPNYVCSLSNTINDPMQVNIKTRWIESEISFTLVRGCKWILQKWFPQLKFECTRPVSEDTANPVINLWFLWELN